MANPAEPISGQICWPSPGSFTGHQRAHQLAARGQKLLAIDMLQVHQESEGLSESLGDWSTQDLRDVLQVPMRMGKVPDSVSQFAVWLDDVRRLSPVLTGGYPDGQIWTTREKRQWSATKKSTRGVVQTKPIDPETFFPLATAAVAYVREFSEDILYARRRTRALLEFKGSRQWNFSDEDIERALAQTHFAIPLHTSGAKKGQPNFRLLSLLLSDGQTDVIFSTSKNKLQARRRAIVKKYLDQGRGQMGAFDVRAAGHGPRAEHQWHENFSPNTIEPEVGALRTACYIVIAITTLMRDSEIQEIEKHSLTTHYGAPAIRTRLVKGQPDHRELLWWLHPVGAEAVRVAEALSDHESHIFSSLKDMPWTDRSSRLHAGFDANGSIHTFVDLINENAHETGLEVIPNGLGVSPHQFRRTMAVLVGNEPGGELALGLILKHVSARAIANSSTAGYATPSAAWLEEFEDLRSQIHLSKIADTWLTEPERHRATGGPGANTYNNVFDQVMATGIPPQSADSSQLTALLRSHIPGFRFGTFNHCNGDKATANCIKNSRQGASIDPFRCEPAKCGNSVITAEHIPLLKDELADVIAKLKTRGLSPTSKAMLEARATEIRSMLAEGADDA